jgi:plastocyanin
MRAPTTTLAFGSLRAPRRLLYAALCGLLLAPVARAEEVVVGQKGKAFSQTEITIKKGDAIVFVNDDTVTHNVFSRSEGFKFNLKMQKPGEQKSIVFDQVGTASVRCAIHPKMDLTVKVEE